MTIKGYTQGYIVQYVVADLDGTVIYTFDDRETAEACAEEGQQIVELDGYGYVADITEGSSIADQCEDPSPYTVHDIEKLTGHEAPFGGYSEPIQFDGLPRFPWTRG